ncbi:hypothetical protein B0T14DRAFT_572035 [Immersiella caudata]|uniref:Methyltransferase domain-containing protein n=1 Tax=Immersiella caudata TaxID=314043 RepID=A0AA39W4R0_9PEZI|nr:hypothetical protein B0T14DRAFT_572035 [Immersiella caudata]
MSTSQREPRATEAIEVGLPEDLEDDEFDPKNYDSSSFAASTSVASSVFEHAYENGRRVRIPAPRRHTLLTASWAVPRLQKCPIPNPEQNREDLKHALMLELTDGKLFFAPIGEHPQKVINLGTGTGIWAIDFADQFPTAEVLGIDFAPIQPDWALKKLGNDFRIGNHLEGQLKAAGFKNISVKKFKVPIGTWPKDIRLRLIGLYFQAALEALFAAIGARPLLAIGIDQVETEVFLVEVRKDLKNTNFHSYIEYLFWTAQKPE